MGFTSKVVRHGVLFPEAYSVIEKVEYNRESNDLKIGVATYPDKNFKARCKAGERGLLKWEEHQKKATDLGNFANFTASNLYQLIQPEGAIRQEEDHSKPVVIPEHEPVKAEVVKPVEIVVEKVVEVPVEKKVFITSYEPYKDLSVFSVKEMVWNIWKRFATYKVW